MTIHWIFLCVALVALWPPLPLSKFQRRTLLNPRRQSNLSMGELFLAWQNWVDFLRAAAGTFLLIHMAINVDKTVEGAARTALIVQGAILLAGVALQTFKREKDEMNFVAPVFYLCGMSFVLVDMLLGAFAVVVAILFALGSKKPLVVLPVMSLAIGVAGLLVGESILLIALNIILILFPLSLGVLFPPKRLVLVGRV